MQSYRFARRSFLASIGGAFGLEILLRNMEAAAQAPCVTPPRFILMHWPVGTLRNQFIPTGSGTTYTTSKTAQGPGYIISPFDTAELRPHTIALHGFNMSLSGQGGGHEDGTPMCTTGANCVGTRANGGEPDDGMAGGPSWDQILLKNVPGLAKRNEQGTIIGLGSFNTCADERIDSHELSTRRLSYSYTKQTIATSRPGGMVAENAPNKPILAPATTFRDLFGSFVPGGMGGGMMPDPVVVRNLKLNKSVLDYSLRELTRLSTLAPSAERVKIDIHAQVIRQLEAQLAQQIRDAEMGTGGGMCGSCAGKPTEPDAALTGKTGEGVTGTSPDYNNPTASMDDSPTHEAVGKAHGAILRAAFQCDILRVATFQWSPGTNHVSFKGLDPNSPNTIYMHHPLSHRVGDANFYNGARPGTNAYIWDAMVNANRWYFQKTADILMEFLQPDPQSPTMAPLIENTIIAFVTEVAEAAHTRNGHGAFIFGGKALGMQGGRFQAVTGAHNQLWSTVAQAFLGANWRTTIQNAGGATSQQYGSNPISGLWTAPT
jgi:hypothetical protein